MLVSDEYGYIVRSATYHDMADEPGKLESLRELEQASLQWLVALCWRGCHCCGDRGR